MTPVKTIPYVSYKHGPSLTMKSIIFSYKKNGICFKYFFKWQLFKKIFFLKNFLEKMCFLIYKKVFFKKQVDTCNHYFGFLCHLQVPILN